MKFDILAFFENLSRKLHFHYNLTRLMTTLHDGQYTMLIIYSPVLLRIRNIWDEAHRQNQNTHFVLSNPTPLFFRRACGLWNNVEKRCRIGQAIDDNMAHAQWMLTKATNILTICNTHYFSLQMCPSVTLYFAFLLCDEVPVLAWCDAQSLGNLITRCQIR